MPVNKDDSANSKNLAYMSKDLSGPTNISVIVKPMKNKSSSTIIIPEYSHSAKKFEGHDKPITPKINMAYIEGIDKSRPSEVRSKFRKKNESDESET